MIATHHQRAIERIVAHFRGQSEVIALLLAGSIAKGTQTDKSDVDFIVILTDAAIAQRRVENRLCEVRSDWCDYDGGYADLKFIPKEFLLRVSEQGSEPARNAFVGARCLYSVDEQIEGLLKQIPVYPIHEKQEKILSFYSALLLSRWLWGEAEKRNDAYLRSRALSEIILYGCRLLLAHNERLFPSQKRLVEATIACPELPEHFEEILHKLFQEPSQNAVQIFTESVLGFRDWGVGDDHNVFVTRHVEDHEQWWWHPRPNIAEW